MSEAKLLHFRQIVEQANRNLHVASVIVGILTWFAVTAAIWLGLFALDNFLNLPTALRFPFAVAGVVFTLALFVRRVLGPLREHRGDERAALMLEDQFGIGENVLINALQFEDMGYSDHQKAFIRATAAAAATGWRHVPLRELWQVRRLAIWSGAFVVLMTLWIGYSVVAPDYLMSAFTRYAFSFSDAPPAAASALVMRPAEDVTVSEYDDLDISLDVSAFTRGRDLLIYPVIRYQEGQGILDSQSTEGEEVKMRPVVGNPNLYQYTFDTVRRSFSFRVFVGSTYTRSVQVTVNPATRIVESTFTVTPPAYVAMPTREQSGPPNPLQCLPASRVDVRVKVSKPIESLRWKWPAGTSLFQDAGGQVWQASFEVGETGGNYDLSAVVKNIPEPIVLTSGGVLLMTDRKPEVRFVDAEMSQVVMPGTVLRLRLEAKDDYGLKHLALTYRSATAGSEPKTLREWSFGDAPGETNRIEKLVNLSIDAAMFAPGNRYFLEIRGTDFSPANDSGVSDPLLVTVRNLEADLSKDTESELKDVYAALERAIELQKAALEGTERLLANSDNVWFDMNRQRRDDEAIQAALDRSRASILEQQIGVRDTLFEGVNLAPDRGVQMVAHMERIATKDAAEANDRAFAAGRVRFHAGDLKRVNGFGPGSAFTPRDTQRIRFTDTPARYFALVVNSAHDWSGQAWLEALALVTTNGFYIDNSSWKLLSSNVKDAGHALPLNKDEQRTPGVLLESLPATFVFDLGAEETVSGVACIGGRARPPRAPKDVAVYLSTDKAPDITAMPLEQDRIDDEFRFLRTVQQMIYNELLALKGREFERLEAANEAELAALLNEDREEVAPSVTMAMEEAQKQLKDWYEENEENDALRNVILSKRPEDLSEDDARALSDLDLKKEQLARKLLDMAENLASTEWDFADKSEIDIFEVTMHNIQEAMEDDMLAAMALEDDKKPAQDMTHSMDTYTDRDADELRTGQQEPISGALLEPGQAERVEGEGMLPQIGELPAELPIHISELTKSLEDLGLPPPESGAFRDDHDNPAGSPVSDNLDSASAAGQMADQTPNPLAQTEGRGNVGRAGRADGQMVATMAPPVPDNEVAMPPRMSDSAAESGMVYDEDIAPASAVGVGKGTGKAVGFEQVGKLPPDALNKLQTLMGPPDSESTENTRGLLLALNRHHLPTADLKQALNRLEQASRDRQGVGARQALNDAITHMRAAEEALAGAYERRAREIAEGRYSDAYDVDTAAGVVPAGYEAIVSSYFKAVAEESSQ